MPKHDNNVLGFQRQRGGEDVTNEGDTRKMVEDFRRGRFHPGALTSGEYHHRQ